MATKTGQKYIICDAAPANWGKSTTLLEVIKLFKANPSAFISLSEISKKYDHWIVFQEIATSKTILIQTGGDNANPFMDTKNYLNGERNVDIIICASRSRGSSWQEVLNIAKMYHYKRIQFSNFCPLDRSLFKIPAISDVNKVYLAQLIYNFALAL